MIEKIDILELYDECSIIYDYELDALALHIYDLHLKFNKNIAKVKILQDLENKRSLEKYRLFFIKVMDCFKDEIEDYKEIIKFEIRGCHSSLLYCYDNIERVKKLERIKKVRMEKELVKVIYYAERLLDEVFESGKDSK
jgi:hypothetical protein